VTAATSHPAGVRVRDEWDGHRLDLDAYLQRIGHDPGRDRSGAALAGLHRAHVAAIAFENLDIVLGRGVSVELDDVQAKLVHRRRGGYCYEHGLVFAAALQRLGFTVDRRLARIASNDGRPRARTHMVLQVHVGNERWLADVGFGSGLLEPLPLRASGARRQGDWAYSLASCGAGWQLREHGAEPPRVLYDFDDASQHIADVRVANHYSSTVASSPFVGRLVAVRKDEHTLHELLGRELTETGPRRPTRRRELSDHELADTLQEDFGLPLTRNELAALIATLPAAGDPR
jgi:N-hydroxyarylamine O-acetyltransferase